MKSAQIVDKLFESIHNREIEKPDLVQIFEHIGRVLNAKTISNYARENEMSYNGAKCQKETASIDGVKFIIKND